ncbi:hypothetical protein AAFN86_17715 [Roseomonas sp. CAU 1739]|uniref:hypothetical protein n=1 Tax=Roseomonas sp. CAU 1739 TaxID=3140364 RepID=UPI00325B3261
MAIDGVAAGVTQVPIVIYAFDRPDYLDVLCRGLLAQTQVRADPARIFLLQDGAVSARTGHLHARPALINRSTEVFRRHFPEGQVVAASHNLGIAENVFRGQRHVFETLDEEVGYFFEDDLEPGPLYLAALEAMRAATEPFADRVGHFAAYGPQRAAEQGPEVGYRQLGHHWGFGLRRAAWQRIHAQLGDWWEEIRRNDYRARNRRRLFELWRRRELSAEGIGQDAANEQGCLELGLARINTTVCFGRYVGVKGEHFTPGVFRNLGFEEMRWAEGEHFAFQPLDAARVEEIAQAASRTRTAWRREALDQRIAQIESERDDADRLVTEAEVAALWHLMLDRRRVPPGVMERHVGKTRLRDLRREIVRMREFQHQTGP